MHMVYLFNFSYLVGPTFGWSDDVVMVHRFYSDVVIRQHSTALLDTQFSDSLQKTNKQNVSCDAKKNMVIELFSFIFLEHSEF